MAAPFIPTVPELESALFGGDPVMAEFVPRVTHRPDHMNYPRIKEHAAEYLHFIDGFDYRNRIRRAGVDAAQQNLGNAYMSVIGMISKEEDKMRFFLEVSGPACRMAACAMRLEINKAYYVDREKQIAWDMYLLEQSDEKPT